MWLTMLEETLGHIPSIYDNPPQDQWAKFQAIKGRKVVETFTVPFTQKELDAIIRAREAMDQEDFLKGYANGGPEREYRLSLQIPYRHRLDDRRSAIEALQRTVRAANSILDSDDFSPGLDSRRAVVDMRDALSLLELPEEKEG